MRFSVSEDGDIQSQQLCKGAEGREKAELLSILDGRSRTEENGTLLGNALRMPWLPIIPVSQSASSLTRRTGCVH